MRNAMVLKLTKNEITMQNQGEMDINGPTVDKKFSKTKQKYEQK